MPIGIGLYGLNGHQIADLLVNNPRVRLVAICGIDRDHLPESLRAEPDLAMAANRDELLADPRVDLVSLCSPRRRDQAQDAVRALRAGKHVYAEKPCAMTEADLDRIMAVSREENRVFHEMAGTAFMQPYWAMRELVQSGVLGDIVQVFAQKSYPMHDGRPQDEDVDGGLICQNGVHALRFIEHVAGTRIATIQALETSRGNQVPGGGLQVAASYMMQLANGGVATAIANYLNPKGFGSWGNDHVRIFGTLGFVESVDAGARTRLVLGDNDCGPLDIAAPAPDFFDAVLDHVDGRPSLPFDLESELHPTRMVIRAKAAAGALS